MSPDIVKKRWLGFLIWQSISSTFIFLFYKTFILSPFINTPFSLSLFSIFSFITFHLSLLLFSLSLSLTSSPQYEPSASLPQLAVGLVRVFLKSLVFGGSPEPSDLNFSRRARKSLGLVVFVIACGLSGFLSVVSVCGGWETMDGPRLIGLGFSGFVFGVIYGALYVYKKRWILGFPIIQRPLFFSFKMGVPSSLRHALKLSTLALLCSTIVLGFLPDYLKRSGTMGRFIIQQIAFYVGISVVSFCWEMNHHLLQVLLTRRCIFAPPQGSAAAETNPSEPLLAALEQSTPRSLFQYLAYLDLCMVSESNVDAWRRAAFFEETGETYRRVVFVCLRPLEQLTSRLGEGLEVCSVDASDLLSQQLLSPTDNHRNLSLHGAFNDFQLCAWCASTVAALAARSHSEDRFGVAQLTGCNAAVVSTLLSCLLAAEACLGKKTTTQPSHLMGPANIKWATLNAGRRDVTAGILAKKRGGGALHGKAYAMADIMKTSVYGIVSVFHDEMMANLKAGNLEKDWIVQSKPLYGTPEILVQKLKLFLDFRAS